MIFGDRFLTCPLFLADWHDVISPQERNEIVPGFEKMKRWDAGASERTVDYCNRMEKRHCFAPPRMVSIFSMERDRSGKSCSMIQRRLCLEHSHSLAEFMFASVCKSQLQLSNMIS